MTISRKQILIVIFLSLFTLLGTGLVNAQSMDNETQRINTIELMENSDAVWTIELRTPLNTENEISNFQSYIKQINSEDTTQTDNFRSQFETVVSASDNRFDRNMSVESLNLNATIEDTTSGKVGITIVEFRWSNFAQKNGEDIIVGNIISEGYTISDGERFRIVPPANYTIDKNTISGDADINSDTGVVEWFGPHAFSNLEINYTHNNTQDSAIDNKESIVGYNYILYVAIVVFILVISYFSYIKLYGNEDDSWSVNNLETDEEKIVGLLEENDGRIKQKKIEDEFEWSKTKVSRLTSKLEDDNVIEKLTIGRENLINLNAKNKNNN